MTRHLPCALAFLIAAALPLTANASPWTVPDDELALSLSYDFQFAGEEFLRDGTRQTFPLEGEFASSNIALGGRYGFSDRFEGFFLLNFKQVSYASRPLLAELPEDQGDIEATRAAISNFSDTSVGAGDVFLGGRYNLHRGTWVAAVEVMGKLPTGYPDPTGLTVTRGDGQVDLQPSLLIGSYVPWTRSFVRLDLGYNLRLGGPGHQAVGGFKLGQFLGEKVILFGGVGAMYTLFEGAPVEGELNYVAINPEVPAEQFSPDDFRTEALSLDRDMFRAEAGAILRLQTFELQIAYSTLFAGANVPTLRGLNVSVNVSLPDVTADGGPEIAPGEEEVIEEVIVEEVPAEEASAGEGEEVIVEEVIVEEAPAEEEDRGAPGEDKPPEGGAPEQAP